MPNMLRTLKGDRQLADQIIGEVEDSLWLAEEVERRVSDVERGLANASARVLELSQQVAEAKAETARAKAWGQKGWDQHNLQWDRREVSEVRLATISAIAETHAAGRWKCVCVLCTALAVEQEGETE